MGAASASAIESASAVEQPTPLASAKRTPIAPESLVTPPLTPPTEAIAGPGGTHFQILRAGTGVSPGPVDTLVLDFSMWTSDGHLVTSSYPQPEPGAFSVGSLPEELRVLLTQLKCGSKVRYWLPRSAAAGWKPKEWPDADLVFELEPLSVTRVVVRDASGNQIDPQPYQPPDGAGAPASAVRTPSGLAYTFLAHSSQAGPPPRPGQRVDVIATVYVIDGLAVRILAKGLKTATTLERAPGKLNEALGQLSSGDQVRVWLPKELGRQIVSEAGTRETIVDLAVSFGG